MITTSVPLLDHWGTCPPTRLLGITPHDAPPTAVRSSMRSSGPSTTTPPDSRSVRRCWTEPAAAVTSAPVWVGAR
jgi:hypothetical protein